MSGGDGAHGLMFKSNEMGSSAERRGLTQHPAEYSAKISNHSNYSDSKIYSTSNQKDYQIETSNINDLYGSEHAVMTNLVHGSPSPEDRQPTSMTNLTDSPNENNVLLAGQPGESSTSQALSDSYREVGGGMASAAPGRSGMPHSSAREPQSGDPFQ